MLLEHLKHIKALCLTHGIKAYGIGDVNESCARLLQRMIKVTPPRTMRDYMVMLHEIGHLVAEGGAPVRNGKLDMSKEWESEVAATRWAMDTTLYPVDAETLRFLAECLQSYDETKTVAECETIIRGGA